MQSGRKRFQHPPSPWVLASRLANVSLRGTVRRHPSPNASSRDRRTVDRTGLTMLTCLGLVGPSEHCTPIDYHKVAQSSMRCCACAILLSTC